MTDASEMAAAAPMEGMALVGHPHHLLLARWQLDADGRDWLLFLRQVGNELLVALADADGTPRPGWWGRNLPPCFAAENEAQSIRAVAEWLERQAGSVRIVGLDVIQPLTPSAKGR